MKMRQRDRNSRLIAFRFFLFVRISISVGNDAQQFIDQAGNFGA